MLYSEEQIENFADNFSYTTFPPHPDQLIQYFLVNADLKMGKGKTAAQVAHAATIYTYRVLKSPFWNKERKLFEEWYNSIQRKIILKAPETLLLDLEFTGHIAIRDKGFTQIVPDSLTVVTLGVQRRKDVDFITKNLKLL